MAMGRSPLASKRVPLRLVAILTMMLGVCIGGAGFVENKVFRKEAPAGSQRYPPTVITLPGAASSLVGKDRWRSNRFCHATQLATFWPDTAVPAPGDAAPRDYLSKMAALRYQRRTGASTALDPYQVSLNPSVYLVNEASQPLNDDDSSHVGHVQPCHVP